VAAFEEEEGAAAQGLQGEAVARDTVGGIHGGLEGQVVESCDEAAEEGWAAAVVEAEAAEESAVGEEAAPAAADEGGAGEGGRLRGEADEDLGEEVVDVQRRRRRRARAAAEAGRHLALLREMKAQDVTYYSNIGSPLHSFVCLTYVRQIPKKQMYAHRTYKRTILVSIFIF
jgi:hypothetical protein